MSKIGKAILTIVVLVALGFAIARVFIERVESDGASVVHLP
ncbi:MAG TPA: hypothetical protein VGO22_19130 [Pseudorhizobium sp.]|jgi:hypothetical protein|nr:hypothetical protein [Pseudorhizobium sp.]